MNVTVNGEPQPVTEGTPALTLGTAWRLLDEARERLADAQSEREDYAARLKATDESWAKVAAERDEAREQLAKILGWFGDNTSGRYARVSGTVLARAYRDGGLTVPEELRRYL